MSHVGPKAALDAERCELRASLQVVKSSQEAGWL